MDAIRSSYRDSPRVRGPRPGGRGLGCPASVFYLINTPLPKGVRGGGEGSPPPPRPPLVGVVGMY